MADELLGLCRTCGCLPHELFERYTAAEISYAVTVQRVAWRHRAEQVGEAARSMSKDGMGLDVICNLLGSRW